MDMGDHAHGGDKMQMPRGVEHDHRAAKLPTAQALAILVGTFGGLAIAVWLTMQGAPIVFAR